MRFTAHQESRVLRLFEQLRRNLGKEKLIVRSRAYTITQRLCFSSLSWWRRFPAASGRCAPFLLPRPRKGSLSLTISRLRASAPCGSHSFATGMDAARDGDREWPSQPVRASNDLSVERVTFARAGSGDVCSHARSIPVNPIRSAAQLSTWFQYFDWEEVGTKSGRGASRIK